MFYGEFLQYLQFFSSSVRHFTALGCGKELKKTASIGFFSSSVRGRMKYDE